MASSHSSSTKEPSAKLQRRYDRTHAVHAAECISGINMAHAPYLITMPAEPPSDSCDTCTPPRPLAEFVFGTEGQSFYALPGVDHVLFEDMNALNWGYGDGCSAVFFPYDVALGRDMFLVYRRQGAAPNEMVRAREVLFGGNAERMTAGTFARSADGMAMEFVIAFDRDTNRPVHLPIARACLRDRRTYWRTYVSELHVVVLLIDDAAREMVEDSAGGPWTADEFYQYVETLETVPQAKFAFVATNSKC